MMIGANFPDIDIIAAPFGRATEFRRGWTHGVLALVVLPFVLTGLMLLWNRYRRGSRTDVLPKQVLLLSTIAIWTHPTLDWMNSYGLRWLMPFDGTWFYGDSLFIVDPYLLGILGLGVFLSRRNDMPARVAVGVATAYILTMLGLQNFSETRVRNDLAETGHGRQKLVVTASPANPFKWRVYGDDGRAYWRGTFDVPGSRLSMNPMPLNKGADNPVVISAMQSPDARAFLDWARLPFYRVEGGAVRMTDARYGLSISVPVVPEDSVVMER